MSTVIINTTKFLEFKMAKTESGQFWFYIRRTNDTDKHDSAVVITTLIRKNNEYNFLLFKTRRPPISEEKKAEYCIECPAGLIGDIDKNETLEECIKKELLEETGLVANKIYVELVNSSTSAGLSSETLTYVTAIVDDYKLVQQPVNDGGVIAERFLVPAKKVKQYFSDIDTKQNSLAAPTVCGVYFALSRV